MALCPVRVALCCALVSRVTLAQPSPDDEARSARLFEEGRELMEQGRIADACRKLEESERLAHADGTFLNLAVCHERLGRTATAYAALQVARARALETKHADRLALAERHIADLERKLSRITIRVSGNADNVRIYLDDRELARTLWGTAMPIDPGEHWVEARAPGKVTSRQRVVVGAEADRDSVDVGPLAPEVRPEVRHRVTPEAPGNGSGQRLAAYALGGVGVIGIGLGTYFGLRAFSHWSDSEDACPNGRCTQEGETAANDARRSADVASVCFALGGVALAAGTWLFLTSESPRSQQGARPAIWLGGGISGSGATTTLGGRF
jgi:hypothetical protein